MVPRAFTIAFIGFVLVMAVLVGAYMTRPQPQVLCTYAGSPYLDSGIPDACEQGQLPQFSGTMPPEYVEYYQRPNPSLYAEILAKYGG